MICKYLRMCSTIVENFCFSLLSSICAEKEIEISKVSSVIIIIIMPNINIHLPFHGTERTVKKIMKVEKKKSDRNINYTLRKQYRVSGKKLIRIIKHQS